MDSRLILFFMFLPLVALAQHPIDVERASASGNHYDAIIISRKVPRQRATPAMYVAAAKSAWALGLHDDAHKFFDKVLESPALAESVRKQVFLSKAVISHQDKQFEASKHYAERALALVEPESLNWKIWLLLGDNFFQQERLGEAEQRFQRALSEVGEQQSSEVHYRLGETHLKLGNYAEAKMHFRSLPTTHQRAPEAFRYLAQIAMSEKDFEAVGLWLGRGKDLHPEKFLDSWTDFALMQAAIHREDAKGVRAIRAAAIKRYPSSDHWLTLLEAEAEAWEWKIREEEPSYE